jgi:sugar phosphate permease
LPDTAATPDLARTLAGMRHLAGKRDYWIISLGTFCRYGIIAAVQALWAGPYLIGVMGLSPMTAGNLLLIMNLALIVGGPFCGNLSDSVFKRRKAVIVAVLFGMAGVLAVLAGLPAGTGVVPLALLLAAFGFFSSTGMIMYTHIKEGMPIENAGTAMTGINFFTMIGAAAFLQGLGALMQHLYPEASLGREAFSTAFIFCAVCLAAASALYCLTKETAARD